MTFKDRLIRMMEGRYGADELFYLLTGLYLLLTIVNIFVHSWVLHIIGLVIFAMAVIRSLSKNIPARSRENALLLRACEKLGIKRKLNAQRPSRDTVNFAYKKCPGCGKTLRLPRKKGRHNTKCPACGEEFSVKIR
ncbi:MAG: hypothetical protein IIZ73_03395 [Ruminococcus sp.]|nr:hypothetical protein [Ruminococcus sp.]